jgi:hypothetical protein
MNCQLFTEQYDVGTAYEGRQVLKETKALFVKKPSAFSYQ